MGNRKVKKLNRKWRGNPEFMQQKKTTTTPGAGETKEGDRVIRAQGRSWNLQWSVSIGTKTMEEIQLMLEMFPEKKRRR